MKKTDYSKYGRIQDVRIRLSKPTTSGRLYYRYDEETDKLMLSLESSARRPSLYQINIDNYILLDLNDERVLELVDIMIPKRSWKVETLSILPHAAQAADLIFPEAAHRYEFIELPIKVMTDETQSYARVLIGSLKQEPDWIELSEKCFALVTSDQLCGFFVRLQ